MCVHQAHTVLTFQGPHSVQERYTNIVLWHSCNMYFQDLQALLAVLTKEIKMCLSFSGKALTCNSDTNNSSVIGNERLVLLGGGANKL